MMTVEQKVAKKAKNLSGLTYKKGVAVVLLSIDESASEYNADCTYRVRVYFKSKAAISRVGKLLGELRFNKKEMLSRFERGMKSTEVNVNGYEKYSLEGGDHIFQQVTLHYHNDYSGERFTVTLNPTKPLSEKQKEYHIGSVADGEPLEEYFKNLQEQIIEGHTHYII